MIVKSMKVRLRHTEPVKSRVQTVEPSQVAPKLSTMLPPADESPRKIGSPMSSIPSRSKAAPPRSRRIVAGSVLQPELSQPNQLLPLGLSLLETSQ